ncbi:MAG: amidohydrolase family protein [Propionibacteriaceae bacterium]|jgi:predicted amidohydrolase YtcJ|nr:amidohydrolase family protein [Propionibacteriaceae bacterium]
MSFLLRNVRLVGAQPNPTSLRFDAGRITAIGDLDLLDGEECLDAEGAWAIPGLRDAHVHFAQWALRRQRLQLAGAQCVAEAAALVAQARPGFHGKLLVGTGHRPASWPQAPTTTALDAACPDIPAALLSGDFHHAWMNSSALALFNLPWRDDVVRETEWFRVVGALTALEDGADAAYLAAGQAAAALGVTSVDDFEFEPGFTSWPTRWANTGIVKVRAAVYPQHLDAAIDAGVHTGDTLVGSDEAPLVAMGPLKIISDGSLNTQTAYCRTPYAGTGSRGAANYSQAELEQLLGAAHRHGLAAAVHAIGDAAVESALRAFAATGAAGTIEHAQLMSDELVTAWPTLAPNVAASVQPAHLLDDRTLTHRIWPERTDDCFPLRALATAGVELRLGSDAPVSPLDPWLAMAAAVHRSEPGDEPWNPAQSLTTAQALAAATGSELAVGQPADVAVLTANPLQDFPTTAEAAAHLRGIRAHATFVAGKRVSAGFAAGSR